MQANRTRIWRHAILSSPAATVHAPQDRRGQHFGVRREAKRQAALDSVAVTSRICVASSRGSDLIQSAVVATLCRRTPKERGSASSATRSGFAPRRVLRSFQRLRPCRRAAAHRVALLTAALECATMGHIIMSVLTQTAAKAPAVTRFNAAARSSRRTGLEMKSFIPTARQASRSPCMAFAVIAIMGTGCKP
jgi:hypothetical protein